MTGSTKASRILTSKSLFFWGRLILGGIFIFASLDKIHHPAVFAKIVYNYQIISGIWVNLIAIILPWIELLLGVLLIFGRWIPGALLLGNFLLTLFLSLLAFNFFRGLDINCGCFSTHSSQMASTIWAIGRDVVFLALAIYLLINMMQRPEPGINNLHKG